MIIICGKEHNWEDAGKKDDRYNTKGASMCKDKIAYYSSVEMLFDNYHTTAPEVAV